MSKNLFIFIFITCFLTANSYAGGTIFTLEWEIEKLPFKLEIFQSVLGIKNRVGETGILNSKNKIAPVKKLIDGRLNLDSGEDAYLILELKNTSDRNINFSVAPHSTHPGESALGFNFTCLCNGHIYKVGPHETWYRVMRLSNRNPVENRSMVKLHHQIFEVPTSKEHGS